MGNLLGAGAFRGQNIAGPTTVHGRRSPGTTSFIASNPKHRAAPQSPVFSRRSRCTGHNPSPAHGDGNRSRRRSRTRAPLKRGGTPARRSPRRIPAPAPPRWTGRRTLREPKRPPAVSLAHQVRALGSALFPPSAQPLAPLATRPPDGGKTVEPRRPGRYLCPAGGTRRNTLNPVSSVLRRDLLPRPPGAAPTCPSPTRTVNDRVGPRGDTPLRTSRSLVHGPLSHRPPSVSGISHRGGVVRARRAQREARPLRALAATKRLARDRHFFLPGKMPAARKRFPVSPSGDPRSSRPDQPPLSRAARCEMTRVSPSAGRGRRTRNERSGPHAEHQTVYAPSPPRPNPASPRGDSTVPAPTPPTGASKRCRSRWFTAHPLGRAAEVPPAPRPPRASRTGEPPTTPTRVGEPRAGPPQDTTRASGMTVLGRDGAAPGKRQTARPPATSSLATRRPGAQARRTSSSHRVLHLGSRGGCFNRQ